MASGSGGGGAAVGSAGRVACIGAASAAAVALALWLAWPRKTGATREEVLEALLRLREECAAAYADVAALVARAGLPLAAPRAAILAEDGSGGAEEGELSEKLRQAVEQPLVLTAALQEAADRTAAELMPGATAEDLETELQRFADEDAVQQATEEIQAMHRACLEGRGGASLLDPQAKDGEVWDAEALLEMLRELGRAKAKKLEALLADAETRGRGDSTSIGKGLDGTAELLGASALCCCAQAEDEVWNLHWPGNRTRRCGFVPALEHLASKDGHFRDRLVAVERELEALAALRAPAAAMVRCSALSEPL